eukprot:2843862-Prorocentrum_lima.AAC.1
MSCGGKKPDQSFSLTRAECVCVCAAGRRGRRIGQGTAIPATTANTSTTSTTTTTTTTATTTTSATTTI